MMMVFASFFHCQSMKHQCDKDHFFSTEKWRLSFNEWRVARQSSLYNPRKCTLYFDSQKNSTNRNEYGKYFMDKKTWAGFLFASEIVDPLFLLHRPPKIPLRAPRELQYSKTRNCSSGLRSCRVFYLSPLH